MIPKHAQQSMFKTWMKKFGFQIWKMNYSSSSAISGLMWERYTPKRILKCVDKRLLFARMSIKLSKPSSSWGEIFSLVSLWGLIIAISWVMSLLKLKVSLMKIPSWEGKRIWSKDGLIKKSKGKERWLIGCLCWGNKLDKAKLLRPIKGKLDLVEDLCRQATSFNSLQDFQHMKKFA